MATDEFYLAIKFDTERQFKQWGAVLVESTRSDQQIRQVQILTPYQRQQEEKKKIEELQHIETRRSSAIVAFQSVKKNLRGQYLGRFLRLNGPVWNEEDKA